MNIECPSHVKRIQKLRYELHSFLSLCVQIRTFVSEKYFKYCQIFQDTINEDERISNKIRNKASGPNETSTGWPYAQAVNHREYVAGPSVVSAWVVCIQSQK